MGKKGLIFSGIIMSLFSIGFISAQTFSLSDFLSTIDPSTVLLSVLFILFFAIIYFATSKMFKGNKGVPAVISICVSLLIVYGINSATNVQNIFSGFGISNDTLYTIATILAVAFIIFLLIKLKLWALFILGLVFLGLAGSGLIYSTELATYIGLGLLAIWLIAFLFKKKVVVGRREVPDLKVQGPSFNINLNLKKKERQEQNLKKIERKDIGYLRDERNEEVRAKGMAVAAEDYAKQEAAIKAQEQRKMAEENQKVQQEQQSEQNLRKQITSTAGLGSLIQAYNQLQISYNDVQKLNPTDPKLRDIFEEMVRVRDEIKRLKSQK